MAVCIPKEIVDKIKSIDFNLSSQEREAQLKAILGDDTTAREVNKLYEKSRTYLNQKTAVNKFIDGIDGTSVEKKAKIKQRMAEILQQKKDIIQNEDLLTLSKDVYDAKYNLDISLDDVGRISNLKKEVDNLKTKMDSTPDGSPQRLAYGRKVVEMTDIIDNLKQGERGTFKQELVKNITDRFSKEKGLGNIGEVAKLGWDAATTAAYKGIKASLDLSYALRQGFKVLTKNPRVWVQNNIKAFKQIANFTSKEGKQRLLNEFKADIVSRKLYQEALDSGLAIGIIEDFFPTSLAERIPKLGEIFKASDNAFTIFSQGSRMDLFQDMYERAVKNGVNMTPEVKANIAQLANSITGRGSLGSLEKISGELNKIFFSARFIRSQADTFIMPFNPKLDSFTRKEALKSSLATFSSIASLIGIASMFTEVETDWRSSKFGKMKVPGTEEDRWLDLTAGLGSYITLLGRLWEKESKSSTTGKISKLNTDKFGTRTQFDLINDFFLNKLAPGPSTVKQALTGKTFSGDKPTLGSVAENLAYPISTVNMIKAFQEEDTMTAVMSSIADLLGAGVTDYNDFKR